MRTLLFLVVVLCGAPAARAADPSWLTGYTVGVLQTEYDVHGATVSVEGGTVTVTASSLREEDRRGAARSLFRVKDVSAVQFTGDDRVYTREIEPEPSAWRLFPRRQLFAPLLADPRQPQSSGTVTRHFRRDENLVFNGNVGGTFALVGDGDWQFGLQSTIFTQFDMKAQHDDQMTDDFLVGFPYTWRRGKWTTMARLYHISTHTGDEFLLHHPGFNRIKLSYEAVDARTSYELSPSWRLYGGPGYMYRRYPRELTPWYLQGGVEYTDRDAWFGYLRPVVALDLQKKEMYGWGATDISARAGFQIEHRSQPSRRFLVMLEYYRGRDVNGQFYMNPDESVGLGFHLYY